MIGLQSWEPEAEFIPPDTLASVLKPWFLVDYSVPLFSPFFYYSLFWMRFRLFDWILILPTRLLF